MLLDFLAAIGICVKDATNHLVGENNTENEANYY